MDYTATDFKHLSRPIKIAPSENAFDLTGK